MGLKAKVGQEQPEDEWRSQGPVLESPTARYLGTFAGWNGNHWESETIKYHLKCFG